MLRGKEMTGVEIIIKDNLIGEADKARPPQESEEIFAVRENERSDEIE